MAGIWFCEKCNWQGDEPDTAHPEYEDGGWECCPNGCLDIDGNPLGTVLNFAHPINQRKYMQALRNVWGTDHHKEERQMNANFIDHPDDCKCSSCRPDLHRWP